MCDLSHEFLFESMSKVTLSNRIGRWSQHIHLGSSKVGDGYAILSNAEVCSFQLSFGMHIDMVIKRTLILDIGEWPLSTSYCLHLFITSVKILVNSCHWGAKWTSFFYFIAAGSVSLYLKEYGIFATTLQLLTTKLMSELHISDSLSFWYVLLSLSFIFPGA